MTKANEEADIVQEKIYKQGSKRKINANNFYYTIQYLYNFTIQPNNYFFDDDDMREKIRGFYHGSLVCLVFLRTLFCR